MKKTMITFIPIVTAIAVFAIATGTQAKNKKSGESKNLASLGDELSSELNDLDSALTDGLNKLKNELKSGFQGDTDQLNQAIEKFKNSMEEEINQVISSLSDTIDGISGSLKGSRGKGSDDSAGSSVQDTVKHLDGIGSKIKKRRN
jgi:gas vesicle protein